MRPFTRILCPVDFSDESRHAIEHAVMFARWYGARLTGVFVFSPILEASGVGIYAYGAPPVVADIDTDAYVRDVTAEFERAGLDAITFDARVEIGGTAEQILRLTDEGADLVVLGTHGRSGFDRLVLGSVAETVLRKSTRPVLTVPPRAHATSKLPFRRVLCPIDFSKPSTGALELAVSIAQEGDSALTVLHVLEPGEETEPLETRPISVPEYHRERRRWAEERMTELLDGDVRERCRPQKRFAHGKPYREILRVASEEAADVIVMGVHGRNAIDMMLFGSTTNHVVRLATCPVLTLRS